MTRTTQALALVTAIVLRSAAPAGAAPLTTDMDPAWPSVGPGSDGAGARSTMVEVDVELPALGMAASPEASIDDASPLTPPVALGFFGVDGTPKDGFFHKPPDTHLAVGTGAAAAGRVIMVTNSGIQIWNKSGTSLTGPTPLSTFLGLTAPAGFDPKVLFDQHVGRFFMVILDGTTPNPAGQSDLHIAVSTSATPGNLTTDWIKLSGSALTNIGGTETWFDYPSIGADAGALFVTGNMFNAGGGFEGVKIRVFDKSALTGLLAGVYSYVDIDIDDAITSGASTLQPAHTYGATDSGNMYLINRFGSTLYRLWEISGHPSAPFVVANATRSWSAGALVSPGAPQSGTAITLDTLSPRIINAVYRNGHVWAVLSSDTDSDGKTEAFWVKVATNGGSPSIPTVADSGFIDGSDGDEWTFMPAINVAASGAATICYSQSYSDQFPEMRYASRAAGDPAGTFQSSVVAATSPGFYDAFFADPKDRWGDYAATVIDPDDDETFWVANEVVQSSGVDTSIWDTFIAKLVVTTTTTSTTSTTLPSPGVGVSAKKLIIVDKLFVGLAKVVYVSKDQTPGSISKGTGTDVSAVSVDFSFDYGNGSTGGDFVLPAGPSNGASGWLVNKSTVAKYVNKEAQAGVPTGAKVAVVKPDKLLKIVGKNLGDNPIDIYGSGDPGGLGVTTVYRVSNGAFVRRHCSEFTTCSYKLIGGGLGAKLVCKPGVATTCP